MQGLVVESGDDAIVFKTPFEDIASKLACELAVCALGYLVYDEFLTETAAATVAEGVQRVRVLLQGVFGGDDSDYAANTPYVVNVLRFSDDPVPYCYGDEMSVDEMPAVNALLAKTMPDFKPVPVYRLMHFDRK